MSFEFIRLTESDFPLIAEWLNKPHVLPWFGDPGDWLDEMSTHLAQDWISHFRVDHQGQPFGFTQFYETARAPDGPWSGEPPHTYGIDFLIGDHRQNNRGLGTRMVAEFVELVCKRVAPPKIIADPHPENLRSIRVLQKCGFALAPKTGMWERFCPPR